MASPSVKKSSSRSHSGRRVRIHRWSAMRSGWRDQRPGASSRNNLRAILLRFSISFRELSICHGGQPTGYATLNIDRLEASGSFDPLSALVTEPPRRVRRLRFEETYAISFP
jgi:hypothetical protein